jgi:hypothetical protein
LAARRGVGVLKSERSESSESSEIFVRVANKARYPESEVEDAAPKRPHQAGAVNQLSTLTGLLQYRLHPNIAERSKPNGNLSIQHDTEHRMLQHTYL